MFCFYKFILILSRRPTKLGLLLLVIGLLLVPELSAQDFLLGLTSTGGAGGSGNAFNINNTGADFASVSGTNFNNQETFPNQGAKPSEKLCLGADGNFYGMTAGGGANEAGTIFKMSLNGAITTLHHFNYYTMEVIRKVTWCKALMAISMV